MRQPRIRLNCVDAQAIALTFKQLMLSPQPRQCGIAVLKAFKYLTVYESYSDPMGNKHENRRLRTMESEAHPYSLRSLLTMKMLRNFIQSAACNMIQIIDEKRSTGVDRSSWIPE